MITYRALPFWGLLLTLFYCSEKKPAQTAATSAGPGFVIFGYTTGISDSTWVFIETATPDSLARALDSAMVLDNKFELAGRIGEKSQQAVLRTKNFSDTKFLWLENERISFKARKGAFTNAVISGSQTQLESARLDSVIAPLRKSQDSVNIALLETTADKQTLAARLTALSEKEKNAYLAFIQKHPASMVSAYLLTTYKKAFGPETAAQLYQSLSADNKASAYGKSFRQ